MQFVQVTHRHFWQQVVQQVIIVIVGLYKFLYGVAAWTGACECQNRIRWQARVVDNLPQNVHGVA